MAKIQFHTEKSTLKKEASKRLYSKSQSLYIGKDAAHKVISAQKTKIKGLSLVSAVLFLTLCVILFMGGK